MPELPEVENVRRTVERAVAGRLVTGVQCFRDDVVCGDAACLVGQTVTAVLRHGKQLALVGRRELKSKRAEEHENKAAGADLTFGGGAAVCVHLGMTGSLRVGQITPPLSEADSGGGAKRRVIHDIPMQLRHIHILWTLDDGQALWFRDPRRFGGLWAFDSLEALHRDRWDKLGPDALTITPRKLRDRLQGRRAGTSRFVRQTSLSGGVKRPIKAALLDQEVVAGLGNIYVDELLFAVGVHPMMPAGLVATLMAGDMPGNVPGGERAASPRSLNVEGARRLVPAMRRLLTRAIEAGGTTLRDYVDASGAMGMFRGHRVYGRGGLPCVRCGAELSSGVVAGRTTVWCEGCQVRG